MENLWATQRRGFEPFPTKLFGIDLSSTDMLLGLVAEAEKTKTEILFAELQDPVYHMFRRCGLLDRIGEGRFFLTVDDGVQYYLRLHPPAGRC